MGLYAGDTCSRPKEAISQSLRFLDSVGYHEPEECITERKEPVPRLLSKNFSIFWQKSQILGIIAPKDWNSSYALGNLLQSSNLVVGAYSFQSLNALRDVENVVSTVPTIEVYGQVKNVSTILKILILGPNKTYGNLKIKFGNNYR